MRLLPPCRLLHTEIKLKLKRIVVFLCVLLLYISQTCSISLEIVQRHDRHYDKKSENIRAGTIHFGRDHISLGRNLNGTQHVSDTPDDGSDNVQADSPPKAGLASGQNVYDPRYSEVAWAEMQPKVQCTSDLMKFTAQGPGSAFLHLDRGRLNEWKYRIYLTHALIQWTLFFFNSLKTKFNDFSHGDILHLFLPHRWRSFALKPFTTRMWLLCVQDSCGPCVSRPI